MAFIRLLYDLLKSPLFPKLEMNLFNRLSRNNFESEQF